MAGTWLTRFGPAIMALLAAGTATYSLRYYGLPAHAWLGVDPGIRAVISWIPNVIVVALASVAAPRRHAAATA